MSRRYYQPSRTASPVVESPHSTNRRPHNDSPASSRSPSVSQRQHRAKAYGTVGKASLLVGILAIIAGILHMRKSKQERTLDRSERAERAQRREHRHRQRQGRADYEQFQGRAQRKMIEYPMPEKRQEQREAPEPAASESGRSRASRTSRTSRRPRGSEIEYGYPDQGPRRPPAYSEKDRYSDIGRGRPNRRERY